MSRLGVCFLAIAYFCLSFCSARACSLCTSYGRKDTLGQEFDRAAFVFLAIAANPRLNANAGALPGSGATDFHIERILKNHPAIGHVKTLTVERYIPVLDS